jgi:hypothetical protein
MLGGTTGVALGGMTIAPVWGVFVGEGSAVAGVEVARAGPGVFVGGMGVGVTEPLDALAVGVPATLDALAVGVTEPLDALAVAVPATLDALVVGVPDTPDPPAVGVGVMDPPDTPAVGVSVGPGVGDAQDASGIRVK